jgi:hypothetical protein
VALRIGQRSSIVARVGFPGPSAKVLEATREVIREARSIVDSGDLPRLSVGRSGIIGAYEALCGMLEGVDPDQLNSLIGRVARHLEELNHLADDVERVRRLRQQMRES